MLINLVLLRRSDVNRAVLRHPIRQGIEIFETLFPERSLRQPIEWLVAC
jgi:hypothetical protein